MRNAGPNFSVPTILVYPCYSISSALCLIICARAMVSYYDLVCGNSQLACQTAAETINDTKPDRSVALEALASSLQQASKLIEIIAVADETGLPSCLPRSLHDFIYEVAARWRLSIKPHSATRWTTSAVKLVPDDVFSQNPATVWRHNSNAMQPSSKDNVPSVPVKEKGSNLLTSGMVYDRQRGSSSWTSNLGELSYPQALPSVARGASWFYSAGRHSASAASATNTSEKKEQPLDDRTKTGTSTGHGTDDNSIVDMSSSSNLESSFRSSTSSKLCSFRSDSTSSQSSLAISATTISSLIGQEKQLFDDNTEKHANSDHTSEENPSVGVEPSGDIVVPSPPRSKVTGVPSGQPPRRTCALPVRPFMHGTTASRARESTDTKVSGARPCAVNSSSPRRVTE